MRRDNRTIVAATIAVVLLVVATSDANAESFDCGSIDKAEKECTASLAHKEVFTFSCSGATDNLSPPGLGNAVPDVCVSDKWTLVETTCPSDKIQSAPSLLVEGIKVQALSNKSITIENLGYKGSSDKLLNGSCQNAAKVRSAYFNVTIRNSSAAYSSFSTGLCFVLSALAVGSLTTFSP